MIISPDTEQIDAQKNLFRVYFSISAIDRKLMERSLVLQECSPEAKPGFIAGIDHLLDERLELMAERDVLTTPV